METPDLMLDPSDPNYELKRDAWEQLGLILTDQDIQDAKEEPKE